MGVGDAGPANVVHAMRSTVPYRLMVHGCHTVAAGMVVAGIGAILAAAGHFILILWLVWFAVMVVVFLVILSSMAVLNVRTVGWQRAAFPDPSVKREVLPMVFHDLMHPFSWWRRTYPKS